ISAEGNENTDIGHPTTDDISPDYPPGAAYHRDVNNGCLTMPTEGPYVIAVSALGPTGRKSYYSNYGVEQTDVSAPGGDRREFYGTSSTTRPRTGSSPLFRSSWSASRAGWTRRGTRTRRSWSAAATRACAGTTGGFRAPRWPRRTRWASPH